VHEDVGLVDEPPEPGEPVGITEIEDDRALAPIDRVKRHRRAVDERRSPGAGIVAAPRLLDLDHLGAEIAEDLARHGPGQVLADLHDLDARERQQVSSPCACR